MKKFLLISFLISTLLLTSCGDLANAMADIMGEAYGFENTIDYNEEYQKEVDKLFSDLEVLKEYIEENAMAEFTDVQIPNITLPDIEIPDVTLPESENDTPTSNASVETFVDANGRTVPVLKDFPNSANDTALTEYPIDSYYPSSRTKINIDGKEYDFGSAQCLSFARYTQQKLYNQNDYANADSFKTLPGSEGVGIDQLTPESCKDLITQAGEGAHIRTGEGNIDGEYKVKHSMVVTKIDENGFEVIDANGTSIPHKVNKRYYTWEQYSDGYGRRGLSYIKVYDP